ncbi:hypothetical protein EXIGLDRAFT_784116 [Exidia glandulosa HHB12029]|uniref:Uncharacterized protein n=1 Tax=Exidia glandulosa HHB12029 TaxID=1314781 RepID=A0A166MNZ4_EXIGL|nr:hypothetical protein EXIGLDRAFT_784116 [Exidia glandulosa HHB12029]
MSRIVRDPTGDIAPPDEVIEAALPSTMTAADKTAAVTAARERWETLHAADVAAWVAQQDADAEARRQEAAAAETERQRLEEERAAELRKAEEDAKAAAEAKRAKFDIDATAEAPPTIELQAPEAARETTRNGKYVPWFYFTEEICRGAINDYQLEDDLQLIASSDGSVVFRPAKKLPKTPVIPDDKLTFEQWHSGIGIYLRTIKDVGWPDEVCEQMNLFYYKLPFHPMRYEDTRALIIYHAIIRADWHRAFVDNKTGFNIAIISEVRMASARSKSQSMTFDASVARMEAATVSVLSFCVLYAR